MSDQKDALNALLANYVEDMRASADAARGELAVRLRKHADTVLRLGTKVLTGEISSADAVMGARAFADAEVMILIRTARAQRAAQIERSIDLGYKVLGVLISSATPT